ncbi:hypothetical protein CGRA01v4_06712 [Colletotrichum graminicola]|nr:hypothetical protein CGRA01v4_06712 [Colletotrichum graminicola]
MLKFCLGLGLQLATAVRSLNSWRDEQESILRLGRVPSSPRGNSAELGTTRPAYTYGWAWKAIRSSYRYDSHTMPVQSEWPHS